MLPHYRTTNVQRYLKTARTVQEKLPHCTFYLNCPLIWFHFCSLQLNVWKSPSTFNRPVDVLVPSVSLQPVKSFLTSQDLEYEVTIEDLQALLDNEDEEMQQNEGQERSSNNFTTGLPFSGSCKCFRIYHEMDNIASDFPDLASRVRLDIHLKTGRCITGEL
nr:carboxypeptidase A4-like [Aotus nancymaae]